MKTTNVSAVLCAALACLSACGSSVSSNEQARRAYLGVDGAIEKSLALGFAGFNAASSANIPMQSATGEVDGALNITGQVDQGSSANKGMRLHVGMVGYSDGPVLVGGNEQVDVIYDTRTDATLQPELNLSLRNIPNGTFTGTLNGTFALSGDLTGEASLALTFSGVIEDDGTGKTRRQAGSTHVTGSVTSSGGVYSVDFTL